MNNDTRLIRLRLKTEVIASIVKEYLRHGKNIYKTTAALGNDIEDVKQAINGELGQFVITYFGKELLSKNTLTIEKRKKYYFDIINEVIGGSSPISLETDIEISRAGLAIKAIECLNNMEGVGSKAASS